MKAILGAASHPCLLVLVLALGACGNDSHSSAEEHDDEHDDTSEDKHRDHDKQSEETTREVDIIVLPAKVASTAKIKVRSAEMRVLAQEIVTTGTIGFDETRLAHVGPRVSGRVSKVIANLGDEVKKGQSLAILDSMELGSAKADHLKAKAALAVATSRYDRERLLAEKKIASQKEVQDAQAVFRQATAAIQATTAHLRLLGLSNRAIGRLSYDKSSSAFLSLRAPLAGRVVEKHATIGELATPATKIFTIADLGKLWVLVDVYERDLRRIHLGDTASVRADAFPGEEFAGTVSYISDSVDAHTRTLKARIEVPNQAKKLRPGLFVRVVLTDPHDSDGSGEATEAIVIPTAAVQRDGDKQVVFVRLGERRFERRVVRLGRTSADVVEVLAGVKSGEEVAVSDTFILKSEAAKESMGGGHSH